MFQKYESLLIRNAEQHYSFWLWLTNVPNHVFIFKHILKSHWLQSLLTSVTEIAPLGRHSFPKYYVYKQENQEHPHLRKPAA